MAYTANKAGEYLVSSYLNDALITKQFSIQVYLYTYGPI